MFGLSGAPLVVRRNNILRQTDGAKNLANGARRKSRRASNPRRLEGVCFVSVLRTHCHNKNQLSSLVYRRGNVLLTQKADYKHHGAQNTQQSNLEFHHSGLVSRNLVQELPRVCKIFGILRRSPYANPTARKRGRENIWVRPFMYNPRTCSKQKKENINCQKGMPFMLQTKNVSTQ